METLKSRQTAIKCLCLAGCLLIAGTLLVPQPAAAQQNSAVESGTHYLQGGTTVPTGQLEAVGNLNSSIGGCTATLITKRLVLSAAHCVCSGQTSPTGCVTRASFSFNNVFPIDDPATPVNESATRSNVSVQGDVTVHPNYAAGGVWLLNDFALLRLDRPSDEVVLDVDPIPVERPDDIPEVGESITLVGFGRIGANCTTPGGNTKRRATVQVSEISDATIVFNNTTTFACPGDSGGPALNAAGNVVGVASSADFSTNSNYDPTFVAYEWIFGTGRVLRIVGRVMLLRVHDTGTGFGPATDPIDGDVVVRLDTDPDSAFGFDLRAGANASAHRGSLDVLRDAFKRNRTVHVEYVVTGPENGRIIRVIEVP